MGVYGLVYIVLWVGSALLVKFLSLFRKNKRASLPPLKSFERFSLFLSFFFFGKLFLIQNSFFF